MREIIYNLPDKIPAITDYFNPSNMTVKDFTDGLLKAGLKEQAEMMKKTVQELAAKLDAFLCSSAERLNPAKLRQDIRRG